MFDWISVNKQLPPYGMKVQGRLRECGHGCTEVLTLMRVEESDCDWRTEDGFRVSLNWDVVAWRYKTTWLTRIGMKFGWLPVHHTLDPRLAVKDATSERDKAFAKAVRQRNATLLQDTVDRLLSIDRLTYWQLLDKAKVIDPSFTDAEWYELLS